MTYNSQNDSYLSRQLTTTTTNVLEMLARAPQTWYASLTQVFASRCVGGSVNAQDGQSRISPSFRLVQRIDFVQKPENKIAH